MFIHPNFDPIAIHIGSLGIHWYGLMYLLGFLAFLQLGKWRATHQDWRAWSPEMVDDALFFGALGVIFGGLSPEHDISVLSGLQAARVLQSSGHRVTCLFWSKTGQWWRVPTESEGRAFLEPKIEGASEVTLTVPGGFSEQRRMRSQALEFDAVVNCCHGGPGEDGSLTALLRLAGVRVTGPAPDGAALAMDKYATAAIASQIGVDTIPTRLIESAEIGRAHV